jgi:isocitrate dehydrogenase (NAD+)
LVPGDGIGPEVVDAARRAIDSAHAGIDWEVQEMGTAAFRRTGRALPEEALRSIRSTRVALKGPVQTPAESGLRSVNVTLRQELGLFANVRPCLLLGGIPSPYSDVDLVVVRENTEGMYTGFEFEMGAESTEELISFLQRSSGRPIRHDSGISIKAITERATERIAEFAFTWAEEHSRSRVTAGHKANIMKFSDGLFLETARRVADRHPSVSFEDRIIDALCMRLVQAPESFDVLLLPNLYGDVVSELGAGLIGGAGVAPGGHFGGADGLELAVFEPTHGTAPELEGTGSADPIGMILSGAMLLRHIGDGDAAGRLEAAVAGVVAQGDVVTPDLRAPGDDRPTARTSEVAEAVIARL